MFVDGYIFVGGSCRFNKIKASSRDYLKNFVLINRKCKDGNYSSVVIDSKKAIEDAIDYLVKKGHSKIGYVGWSSGKIIIPESKYSGYVGGLNKNNIKLNKNIVFLADNIVLNQYKYSYDAITDYLNNKRIGFTAILAQTDIMGLGALRALQDKTYIVPESVSVILFIHVPLQRYGCLSGESPLHQGQASTVAPTVSDEQQFSMRSSQRTQTSALMFCTTIE